MKLLPKRSGRMHVKYLSFSMIMSLTNTEEHRKYMKLELTSGIKKAGSYESYYD